MIPPLGIVVDARRYWSNLVSVSETRAYLQKSLSHTTQPSNHAGGFQASAMR